MKWSFQKVTAMIVGLAIFLLGGWIMNLVKLVNSGDLQFDAGILLHRLNHVARLESDRFEHGANDMIPVCPARQADNDASGIHVPERGASPTNAGTI